MQAMDSMFGEGSVCLCVCMYMNTYIIFETACGL